MQICIFDADFSKFSRLRQGLGFRLILCFLAENNNSESFWETLRKGSRGTFWELLRSRGTFWRTFAESKDSAPQKEGSQWELLGTFIIISFPGGNWKLLLRYFLLKTGCGEGGASREQRQEKSFFEIRCIYECEDICIIFRSTLGCGNFYWEFLCYSQWRFPKGSQMYCEITCKCLHIHILTFEFWKL